MTIVNGNREEFYCHPNGDYSKILPDFIDKSLKAP